MRVLYADTDGEMRERFRTHVEREADAVEFVAETTVEGALDRLGDGVDCAVVGDELGDRAGFGLLDELGDRARTGECDGTGAGKRDKAESGGRDGAGAAVPVVYLTAASADADLAAEAVSAGALDYVSKEVVRDRPETLVRRVRVAVERCDGGGASPSEKRSGTHFRTMFERHSAPMLLIEPDSGEIREANRAAEEFYGYSDLTEMKIDEINDFSPERIEAERKRAETKERNHFIFDHRLASGEVRTVEVHSSPVELDERLLFSVVHDITERAAHERELERYKDLLDNVPVGVYRNTPGLDGEFVEVNPAMVSMFGAESEAELLDTAVSDLYADETDRETLVERLIDGNVVREHEIELETFDGERFWGSVSAILTTDDDGDRYLDGVIEDTTRRRRYEQRLEEQNEMLELLNRVVRHDIRNDMQVVFGMLSRLEGHVDDDYEAQLDRLQERADRVVDLTVTARDLMKTLLSTTTDGERVALDATLRREVGDARSSFPDAEVRVEGDLPGVEVWANNMLGSVFTNLLQNAVQHNDADTPEVTVSATERVEDVVVSVADNGPGIPDDQKERLFAKGEKGLESEGTGIGLFLVETLVERYGGDVRVTDNEPTGAIFEVELQKADGE